MSESSPDSSFTYRAFISYSHRDKAWGDWLHKALETYRVPSRLVGQQTAMGTIPRRLNPIFRDREELSSSPELGSKINDALVKSESLIVICSPASATSRWVNEEVLCYKRMGRGDRIFCLIVDGEPNATDMPGHGSEECFCQALRFATDAEGRPIAERTEPIAADARQGKDGKANAKLKLIAGMLGVGFDALKQRDLQRRTRRMTAIAALALVVMTITSVLAVYALISRHEAVIAKQHAIVAEQTAQRRQKQAEGLVNFMLGDLSTKLRQVDRLDILSAVDDKAMAYFKSLPATDVNETALAQRAKALQKIGEVRTDQSRLSDAMDAFQQALRLNKRLVERSPDDPKRLNAYGENLLWIGFNDWYQNKLDASEAAFNRAAAALEHAAKLAPTDEKVQQNLDSIYDDLGHVAEAGGELDNAHDDYLKELALDQRLSKAYPTDAQWQNDLGNTYSNLGGVSLARGHLDAAVSAYFKDQQLLKKLVAQNPKNRPMQAQLITSGAILGRMISDMGQAQAGLQHVTAAVKIGKALVTFDPSHSDWQEAYDYYNLLRGRLLLENGDTVAAGKAIEEATAGLEKLVAKDPGNAQWRSNLAEAQLESARLATVRKQPGTAKQLAMQAAATLQKLLSGKSPKARNIRIQADSELLLGQLAADSGDPRSAGEYRQQALARLRPLATNSDDPRNLSLWVEALLATGDKEKAQPAIHLLQTMGYRPAGFVARLRVYGIGYPENAEVAKRVASLIKSGAIEATVEKMSRSAGTANPNQP